MADGAAHVCDLEGAHAPSSAGTAATSPFSSASGSGLAGRRPRCVRRVSSSTETPPIWAIPSTVWRCSRAAMVARTVLTGLLVPSDLVIRSLMPDSSITARMAPPDRMPVPGAAGFSSTLAAPFLSRISWGMVVPTIGTVITFFLAASTALRMASGTSPALPNPAPTRPFWSPTTTRALKENRRPPLTTLATRFRWTTFSANSDRSRPDWYAISPLLSSELQPGFASGLGHRLDPPVVGEATPIEDHGLDAPLFCPRRNGLPDGGRGRRAGARLDA